MDLDLDGKGVVITGGASNIGRALTLGFAEEGARVLIADIDEAQAEAVIAAGPEGRVTQRRTDVTNADEVSATIDHAIATLGGIDVLVNCAGWTVDRLFIEKPREEWEREIAIDMWGFINATRAVLDHMIERGSGRIVSIALGRRAHRRVARGRLLRHQGRRDRDVEGDRQGGRQARHHAQRRLPRLHARRPGGERRALDLARASRARSSTTRSSRRSRAPIRCAASAPPRTSSGRCCCWPPTARRTSPDRPCR